MNTQPVTETATLPFESMGTFGQAMASAFAASNDVHEVYAALRFHRRMTGDDLFGWLDGCLFREWQDRAGDISELAFLELRELAGEWLEGKR